MNDKNGFIITARDRVLKSWENSKEMVRDYQDYAQENEDDKKLAKMFRDFADQEAQHAERLLEVLRGYE